MLSGLRPDVIVLDEIALAQELSLATRTDRPFIQNDRQLSNNHQRLVENHR